MPMLNLLEAASNWGAKNISACKW